MDRRFETPMVGVPLDGKRRIYLQYQPRRLRGTFIALWGLAALIGVVSWGGIALVIYHLVIAGGGE